MEGLVVREVESFAGKDPRIFQGLVSWDGDLASGYKACLWSRFASRVFLELESFTLADQSELYSRSREVAWQNHLGLETTFAVDCTLSGDPLITHSKFAALRLKDAIVDTFRDRFGARPSVDVASPSLRLHLHIQDDRATISLDLSGESLHKRGYRVSGGPAPLKETLAATLVALSGWLEGRPGDALLDPMCGTGTLLIEAALMFGDSAPGLSRSHFGFMGWKQHDPALWQTLVEEAIAREEAGLQKEWPLLLGYDADPAMVTAAKKNIDKSGLSDQIRIEKGEIARLASPGGNGMLLSNLPFGERLSEKDEVALLYRAAGRIARERFAGWRLAFFLSSPDLTDSFAISWEKKYRLFNGDIACRLLVGAVPAAEDEPFCWNMTEAVGASDDEFVNRLRKNMKRIQKWARKGGVHCYRIYDRDLPDYNISIDIYEKWVHLQEYAPPASVDPELARLRLDHALQGIRDLFGIRRDRIFIKTRRRQKGSEQYQKQEGKTRMIEVREGSCRFLVNLAGYLDTGLFLDHRPVRMRLEKESSGKKFLNLFGYSGTATVHAAMGGAVATTTVDLSANYLQWTRMNLALNGFSGFAHRTVRADCLRWLEEDRDFYDLIFVDPPTFSNTKKEKRVFDIQRDHGRLLTLAMQRLAPAGLLIFSTNFRRFRLDASLTKQFAVRDISEETIPYDFLRNTKVHTCWEITGKMSL
jgi:23S rRNA (guanine2445-N2)-methyltransferase / 23S rRNA (guanine2069-N7)-methyltransferase